MSPATDNSSQAVVKPNPIIRVFPSLTDVAFVLPIVFMFWKLGGASNMLEGDTGWHIRAGEWILQNRRVPETDLFSFTMPNAPWFAWEWLWEVAFAWVHHIGGMQAVVFATVVVLCFTSALLFRLVRRTCPNVFIAFAVTWVAVAISSIHWLARPHIFTMLFVVTFLYILELARDGRRRLLWLLPPLTVIWVNMHGGFVLGLMFLGAYSAGEFFRGYSEPDLTMRAEAYSRSRRYGIALAASAAVTFINPYTYRLHLHLAKYLIEPTLYRFANEWQPTSLRGLLAMYVEPMIVLASVAAVWHLLHRRYTYTLLLLAFLHSAFVALRNLPIFAFVAAPATAALLADALERARNVATPRWVGRAAAAFHSAAADFDAMDRIRRVHVASAIAILFLAGGFFAAQPPKSLRAEYNPDNYPVKLVNTLGTALAPSLFTDDEWGDYVIYRLYPSKRVYVDGRFDMYGGPFTESYLDLLNGKHDWERKLRDKGVEQVLLPVKLSLASTLKESSRWQVLYDDGVAILFRWRPTPSPSTPAAQTSSGNLQTTAGAPGRLAKISDSKGGSDYD